jgi:lysylphosphatidylglycerol synthetase-like protein (DUF2156 family)
MFEGWQSFYQMTGGAAATLVGLLFIVATLTTARDPAVLSPGMRLFTTPTVFHFASVLVISGLALAPGGEIGWAKLLMAAWALVGLIHAVRIAIGLSRVENPTHWSDFWWYGVGTAAAYVVVAGAALLACERMAHAAFYLALGLLALLVVTIRNAWDLVTWLAPRRDQPPS